MFWDEFSFLFPIYVSFPLIFYILLLFLLYIDLFDLEYLEVLLLFFLQIKLGHDTGYSMPLLFFFIITFHYQNMVWQLLLCLLLDPSIKLQFYFVMCLALLSLLYFGFCIHMFELLYEVWICVLLCIDLYWFRRGGKYFLFLCFGNRQNMVFSF